MDWSVSALAEQFTLIEYSLFKQVDLKELCNIAWRKSAHPRRDAINVVNLYTRCEMVSMWTATEVVSGSSIRQRATTIEKLVQLAQKCVEVRNYNTSMEILGGLNRHVVQRMKKSWEAVSPSIFEIFQSINNLFDTRRNFSNYRYQLKRGILPCLPFMGVILHDLTFADEVSTKVDESINFEKVRTKGRILKDMHFFQKVGYPFEIDQILQPMLHRLLAMPEDLLLKHSRANEPPLTDLRHVERA